MNQEARDWLPTEAMASNAVNARIAAVVEAWSARWFAKRAVASSTLRAWAGSAPPARDGAPWRLHSGSVAISLSKAGATRLSNWALDANSEQSELTDTDHRLIDGLQRRLVEDLVLSVETAFGDDGGSLNGPLTVVDPFAGQGGLVITLAQGQSVDLATLAIPRALALAFCRELLGPRTTRAEKLEPLSRALSPMTISLEAVLGRVDLGFAELAGLAAGDVLILDRRLDDSADLFLVGAEARLAQVKLTEVDGLLALAVQA